MVYILILFLTVSSLTATDKTEKKELATPTTAEAKKQEQEVIDKNKKSIPTKKVSGKDEIVLGCSLPTSGGDLAVAANQISDGMTLFFNKMMKEKNGPSFTCALKVLDDANNVLKLTENITTTLKESPIIISPYGTDTLTMLKSYIMHKQAVVLFPLEGSNMFRTPDLGNAVFFRASHAQELEALVSHAVTKLGKREIALFHEASEWGRGVLKDTEAVLKKHGLTLFAASTYPQNSLNITQGAEALVQKAPPVVLCIAGSRPAYNFIRHMINRGLHQTVFLGLTALTSIQETLAQSRGIKIITSSVVPDPTKSQTKIAQEFRADMQSFFPNKPLSPFTFEGYINAYLTVEGLKKTKSIYTPEALIKSFEKLKHVRFRGIDLKFNPDTRSLSSNVWLNLGDGNEWTLFGKEGKKTKKKTEPQEKKDKPTTEEKKKS